MPKEKKSKIMSTKIGQSTKHAPLGQVIQDDINRNKYATRKISGMAFSRRMNDNSDDEGMEGEGMEEMLDEKTSRKIIDMGIEQQREVMEEDIAAKQRVIVDNGMSSSKKKKSSRLKNNDDNSSDEDDSDDDNNEEEDDDDELVVEHDNSGYVNISSTNIGLTPEEEALLSNMMGNTKSSSGGGNGMDEEEEEPQRRNLADIIMAKIEEKEAMAHAKQQYGDDGNVEEIEEIGIDLPPKVVQVYTDIGKLLTHYTSGKLPKAFKVIPSLHNWEEVLYLTRPDQWTPQAMYAATRIFASNLNPKMAQRFYNLVLLDAVRADIYSNKKLNYHYYQALKKSVYKPAAFFKGILLPLCKSDGNCTLREAIIIASVLQKVSIPVHHSAVAIHKLALMTEYNGAASIFIKYLLDKKYSLPAPVIKSLVAHFTKFITVEKTKDGEDLPVLWHQALLVFVQRYKNEISVEGKEQLRDLMKVHNHPKITVEVRRELFGSAAWREERMAAAAEAGGEGSSSMIM